MTRIKTSEDELFASSFERNKKDAEYIRSTNYAGFIPGPWYKKVFGIFGPRLPQGGNPTRS